MEESKLNIRTASYPSVYRRPKSVTMMDTVFNVRYSMREYFAEFIGAFVVAIIGNSIVAQVILNPKLGSVGPLMIGIGYGIAVAAGVFIAAPTSGGHINPTITLAFAAVRGFAWRKVPGYLFAQTLGSCAANGLILLIHGALIDSAKGPSVSSGKLHPVAMIFASYAPEPVANSTAFIITVLQSALLLLAVMGIADPRNEVPRWMFPCLIGVFITLFALALPGYCVSPAADLAGRLVSLAAGWSPLAFSMHRYYSLIAFFAPFIGALIGASIYDIMAIPSTDDEHDSSTMA